MTRPPYSDRDLRTIYRWLFFTAIATAIPSSLLYSLFALFMSSKPTGELQWVTAVLHLLLVFVMISTFVWALLIVFLSRFYAKSELVPNTADFSKMGEKACFFLAGLACLPFVLPAILSGDPAMILFTAIIGVIVAIGSLGLALFASKLAFRKVAMLPNNDD